MDISQTNWNETDDNNNTAAPDGAPEGMPPSGVNNTMRAMMGAIKRWYDQFVPAVTTGSSTVYTLAYSVAPTALVDGMRFTVKFHATCGAAPTLNVNILGAKPLFKWEAGNWVAVTAGDIVAGQKLLLTYDQTSGNFQILSSLMSISQLQNQAYVYSADSGVADAYVIAPTPAPTAYSVGQSFEWTVAHVNATTTPTLKVGSLNAGTITWPDGSAVQVGQLPANAVVRTVVAAVSTGTPTWHLETVSNPNRPVLSKFTAALGGAVALNNTTIFFDGPSVNAGTTGIFFISGKVTLQDTGGLASFFIKLWDGTTIVDSSALTLPVGNVGVVSLSGIITNPAGNLKISVQDASNASGNILSNNSGGGRDSSVTAIRIG